MTDKAENVFLDPHNLTQVLENLNRPQEKTQVASFW